VAASFCFLCPKSTLSEVKTSLVIGAGGQDGTLLTQLLAGRGDQVVCVDCDKIWSLPPATWEPVDILQSEQVLSLVRRVRPDECYYLAAFHHSAEDPGLTHDDTQLFERSHAVHVRGLLHCLHAITQASPKTRLFYAASSHVFGFPAVQPQDESTPLNPQNVYGITKTTGIYCCRYFRAEPGVFASVGILYNHESHLRAPQFLSSKIVRGVLAFQKDSARKLVLGDLNAVVDWGYAPDYVEAMTRILGHTAPDDFVVATGEPHSVGEFLQIACEIVGVDPRECATLDARLLRKKSAVLIGNSGKLRAQTGWQPRTSFRDMIKILIEHARRQGE
jgi:GDPmannose 4,6-dehydratase